jgi:hypothetical protein
MNFADPAFFTDFAIDITVNGLPARGIFDNGFAAAFNGMVDGSSPVLHLLSAVPVACGDTVIISAASYTVTGVEPDGTGVTQLRLDKA